MTETAVVRKMILTDLWDAATRQVVGEIAISFAQLEHVLWLLPKRIKQLEMSVWENMAEIVGIPTRCNQIAEAYPVRAMHQGNEADLDALLSRVKAANEKRNGLIHGRWGCKKVNGEVVSRHRIWRGRDRGIDLAELTAFRTEVRELRDQLGAYRW
jgi:hypothetical protein